MTLRNKEISIKAGIICFSVFMIPWLLLALIGWIAAPEGFQSETLAAFLLGIIVFAFVSVFLGFSIFRKSKLLKLFSYVFIAAVPIAWVFWIMGWIQ
jgi:hypothetical protein